MRQKFDVGDIVEVTYPSSQDAGIILETQPINKSINYSPNTPWHPDEYKCRVKLFNSPSPRWIRAKWLAHLSKII